MSQRTKFYGLSENLEGHVVSREYGKDCRAQEFDWVPHSPRSHALNKNELCILCRTLHVDNMDMDNRHGHGRLPTTDSRRMQLRDEKMWRRESERQMRTGDRTSRCPCTLCLYGRPLLRTTQAKHLRDYGRHPMRRLQEEVQSPWCNAFCFSNAMAHHDTVVYASDNMQGCNEPSTAVQARKC